jgi:hypothetical protein
LFHLIHFLGGSQRREVARSDADIGVGLLLVDADGVMGRLDQLATKRNGPDFESPVRADV